MSQSQTESTQSLLVALANQLRALHLSSHVIAVPVSIKLPKFWRTSPEIWFIRVEVQFGTKQNISQVQIEHDYVVISLGFNTAEEVHYVLVSPPVTEEYVSRKRALIGQ